MYDPTIAKRANDLDSILEAFERQHETTGAADVAAFLPHAGDPQYAQVAVELIRVDLERSWARGSRKPLHAYRELTPQLFADCARLSEIAFEEYRLRKQSGEHVSSHDYARRYSIDTSGWPADDEPVDASVSTKTNGSLVRARASAFPQVGDTFVGFQLVEQLGRGAFGVVFRAKQSDLAARDVVLKITAARSVEPQRLARLQHTNIVPIYSMHEQGGLLAICMPYFGRRTFAELVRSNANSVVEAALSTLPKRDAPTRQAGASPVVAVGESINRNEAALPRQPMAVKALVEMIAQLAEALAHAHERGIVHSDIKPANVLLTDDGVPMLLDFNLSNDSFAYRKATLLVGGTLPYMAPEHLRAMHDGAAVAAPSDIYSLGVIAFELLSGRRPFVDRAEEFEQDVDPLIADRERGASSIVPFNPRVSPGLASIIAHCLEADVQRRYATASQLVEDLRRYQNQLPLRYAPDRSIRERGGKWLWRNARGVRWAATASAVALFVLLSAMITVRQYRLADLSAQTAFTDFENDYQAALLDLRAPGNEPELHRIGAAIGEQAIDRMGLTVDRAGTSKIISRLPAQQQDLVRQHGVELLYALASGSTKNDPNDRVGKKKALELNASAFALLPGTSSGKSLLEQRAELLKAVGDEPGATRAAEQSTKAASDEHNSYLAATALLRSGKYAQSVAAWERLCAENPHDPTRWLLLGNSYAAISRFTNAEACYTALIALQPNAMAGYLYRGICRADQGNFPAAERDYTEALRLNPAIATTRINRALAYYAMGNFEAADRDATAAISDGLADPRAYFVRALIRDAMKKAEEATADRERGFASEPIDDKGWVARGIALLKTDPERAANEFEEGIHTYPNSKPLLQNLIHVYGDRLHRTDDALVYAEKQAALFPTDSAALASRAVLFARKSDAAAAVRDAQRAAAARPPAVTMLQLSCVYALLAKTAPEHSASAIAFLRKALAADPTLAKRAAIDPDLANMKTNADFESLLSAAARLTESILTSPAPAERAHEPGIQHSLDESTKRS